MSEHDELRDRMARLDPMSERVSTEPITSPSARALLEEIMNTPTTEPVMERPAPTDTDSDTNSDTIRGATNPRPRRTWWLGSVAATVVAALAIGGFALSGAFDGDEQRDVLALSTGDVDPSMMMCMELTAESIAMAPIAFRATVDAVDGELVTMTVDHWYKGGDADAVSLTAPAGMEALIAGLDFQVGETYLVTAYDGVVNYCGATGPATPELQSLFDQAFPG